MSRLSNTPSRGRCINIKCLVFIFIDLRINASKFISSAPSVAFTNHWNSCVYEVVPNFKVAKCIFANLYESQELACDTEVERNRKLRNETHSHGLQVILITLAQFAGDHGLGLAHVLDCALNRDNTLQIEAVNVVDAADSDLRVSVLHDSLDRVSALADNSSNEIVMR